MQSSLTKELAGAARKRWIMLMAGFALLAVLFVFAGMIRTPGARKNPYTVIASRALAVAGALLLMRIMLLTHEDGLPVFLIEASGLGDESLADALDLIDSRFDIVPLADVTAFIRDQRYVPRKGAAVVVRVAGREDLNVAREAVAAGTAPPVTLLLAEQVAYGMTPGAGEGTFPAGTAFAVEVGAQAGKAGTQAGWALDEDKIAAGLRALAEKVGSVTGRAACYALFPEDDEAVLARIGKTAGIEAFFGGEGLNRYGDRGNRIRLADITALLTSRRSRGARLKTFATMYRGNYVAYPTWVWLDMTAPVVAGGDRGQGGPGERRGRC